MSEFWDILKSVSPDVYGMVQEEMKSRVIAILNSTDTFVNLLGYGKYLGDVIHPVYGFLTPKILLDNGDIVWGCECWWGNVEEMEKRFFDGKREIRHVKIEDYRDLPWS